MLSRAIKFTTPVTKPKPEIQPKRTQPTTIQPNPGKPTSPNIGKPKVTPITTPKRAML